MKEIVINEEKCTGCRICEMICAWNYAGRSNPEEAFLKVSIDEKKAVFKIKLTENCNACGLCAKYCSTTALEIRKVLA